MKVKIKLMFLFDKQKSTTEEILEENFKSNILTLD